MSDEPERIAICGMGWVTPLGNDVAEVTQRIAAGDRALETELRHPETGAIYHGIAVPKSATAALDRVPRLRRSSAISFFSTTAALAALEDAGLKVTPENEGRIAIIFAIADGGVVYTRKFYDGIVKDGGGTSGPLLFPETVYNAPASHLAALLGVTGMTYTLVGDASVGLAAIKYAEQILRAGEADYCVVAGAEELDWVLCAAYADWRLPARLSEGGAALVLGREGAIKLAAVHDGVPFFRQSEAAGALELALEEMAQSGRVDGVVLSANGTFIDAAELAALAKVFPGVPTSVPKQALGEAVGASALMQVIVAAQAVRQGDRQRMLVSCVGLNQQASALVVSASARAPR